MKENSLAVLTLLVVAAFSGSWPCTASETSVGPMGSVPPESVQEPTHLLAGLEVRTPRLTPRPTAVKGVRRPHVSLNGQWKFSPSLPGNPVLLSGAATAGGRDIAVPGEWVMQGFTVAANEFACYIREVEVPKDWNRQRIKLRFDAVHSECRVWVNGTEVGGHEGGFVPFECDVTDAARPGRNRLVVAVRNESVSDVLASATQYAGHPLGGITRKVTLFAVPKVNIAAQAVTTQFDAEFRNAVLTVHLEIANESGADLSEAALAFRLNGPDGRPVQIQAAGRRLPVIRSGQTLAQDLSVGVAVPKQWDTEHPNCYTLRTEMKAGGQTTEVITQRFGFRQVEVRGNQVFVNGRPIKLRGVCRHETHPLLGRSLSPELWRKDAETFRAANVNYIRTSHYPPAEEFLDACDELGLFVECESALCWVQHGANTTWGTWGYRDPRFFPYLARANLENVIANRNHPSIILWSLANESRWSPLFAEVLRRIKQLDPSRPTSFHDQCWGNNQASTADIANYHYPDTHGPAQCDQGTRPTLFGEYCHVETYNQQEIFTDPGVRDQWGPRFAEMVDLMYGHPGCLGGAIWSGIDDVFHLPEGQVEGYGFWGVIDNWRRAKPETFHVRKAYSPVRVTTRELPVGEGILKIAVENRYNFANLSELKIEWSLGREHGTVAADVAARSAGAIALTPKGKAQPGQSLRLRFTDPRGFECEEVEWVIGKPGDAVMQGTPLAFGKLAMETRDDAFIIKGAEFTAEILRTTGQLRGVQVIGKPVLVGGPILMLLPIQDGPCKPQDLTQFGPLNAPCANGLTRSVTAAPQADGSVSIDVRGEYAEADGRYALRIAPQGELTIEYDFTMKKAFDPRQAGLVFYAARDCDRLSWHRKTPWTVYPADHIGRPIGIARANPNDALHGVHLIAAPKVSWSQDTTALGTADFRSTKQHFLTVSLRDRRGAGVVAMSDGAQSARAFVDGHRIGWLIAEINTGGGDPFFSRHHTADRHPLKAGDHVAGTIRLHLVKK